MWWMWIVGPALLLVIYLLTGARDKRAEAEVERWRRDFWPRVKADEVEGSNYRAPPIEAKAAPVPGGRGAKQVSSLPGLLHRMILACGGGEPVMRIELVPKIAYLAAFAAGPATLSDQKTVVARLEAPVPAFSARPLPIMEGARLANTGVAFKKDPDFMSFFLVEAGTDPGANAPDANALVAPSPEVTKKIRAFLSRPIRDALRDLPDAWLRIEDKAMALTLYGPVDAEKIDQLVTIADVIFAEYGADGGPSLFGEEDDADDDDEAAKAPKPPAAAKAKPKKKPAAAS
jgi:hypothetical protein